MTDYSQLDSHSIYLSGQVDQLVQVHQEYDAALQQTHSEVIIFTSTQLDAVFFSRSILSSRCHQTIVLHCPTAPHAPLHHHRAVTDTQAAPCAVRFIMTRDRELSTAPDAEQERESWGNPLNLPPVSGEETVHSFQSRYRLLHSGTLSPCPQSFVRCEILRAAR